MQINRHCCSAQFERNFMVGSQAEQGFLLGFPSFADWIGNRNPKPHPAAADRTNRAAEPLCNFEVRRGSKQSLFIAAPLFARGVRTVKTAFTAISAHRTELAAGAFGDFPVGDFAKESLFFGCPWPKTRRWIGDLEFFTALFDRSNCTAQQRSDLFVRNCSQQLILFAIPFSF